ncbi:MAG: tyrosine-type recombinase/integrase [Bacteroidetes bacterium]|nr:tyrosine-type recombinase/integrase [Bacteroidota bacterium]
MNINTTTEGFLQHCRIEKNLSPKTLKAYTTDLGQFTSFLKPKEKIADVNKQDIRDYLSSISTLKPKSVKRKIATIKALFNFLEFEDCIALNPFRRMRIKIKEPQRLPVVMDLQEIQKIFKLSYFKKKEISNEKSYSYKAAVRNIAVLELLFSTGARVSEIAELKTDNINLRTGIIIIKGKGNKERIIHICNKETNLVLNQYYSLYQKQITASGWFLINRFNQRMTDQSIRNMVKKTAKEAALPKVITPHIFRHSFATLLLERDVDIKYIQSLLGHSSITTTQIYTHVNRKRQQQLLKAKHPRKEFFMQV